MCQVAFMHKSKNISWLYGQLKTSLKHKIKSNDLQIAISKQGKLVKLLQRFVRLLSFKTLSKIGALYIFIFVRTRVSFLLDCNKQKILHQCCTLFPMVMPWLLSQVVLNKMWTNVSHFFSFRISPILGFHSPTNICTTVPSSVMARLSRFRTKHLKALSHGQVLQATREAPNFTAC